jgi:flavin reductase (DIM6/NTAB) family NADH-FMN oxidoreductase RutF
MEIRPESLSRVERYRFLISAVTPRPIALVSTVSSDGYPNLAPYSFFNAVSAHPMTMVFCPANGPEGQDKDSLRNARPVAEGGTGEFVVNVSVEAYERKVAAAAEPLPPGESEFSLVGLTPSPCRQVSAPRVLEAPVSFECKTRQILALNPGVPGGGNLVLGEVVHIWVDDALVKNGLAIDPDALRTIGRMGGISYSRTRETFEMPSGREALEGDQRPTPANPK